MNLDVLEQAMKLKAKMDNIQYERDMYIKERESETPTGSGWGHIPKEMLIDHLDDKIRYLDELLDQSKNELDEI